ncbi:ABC transporter substrate-binding protein [Aphanothece hegewaldii CCALA 016]|uniref:ABC transporter substrate-binding protein n=1 Tax=Aphanothece hegewaldii CCALA 016 TaxID=2107694 RepID=A0A2T1LS13_9CHRO|nr:ABC transporter substrate-binding protein [Aphanothece hegewaldii]PSF32094.1 ABC transporter substrate-binding protein [Aphanothece hegewaldii CCALA 016]
MLRKQFKLIAIALLVAVLISCQNFLSHSSKNQPVTIKISGWGDPIERRLLQEVIQNFETTHPNIKVKYEVISEQYMDVIQARLIGNAAPDVFYLDAIQAPFLMDKNVLEPLESYITPAFNLADFEENFLSPFKYDTHIYGLPKDYSTLALFYNKKALADVGLNQPPQTWDELLTYSQRLTVDRNGNGRIDQYGLGVTPELARLAYIIKAFGGLVVNQSGYATFASDESLAGLRLVVDQYQERTSVRASDVGAKSGGEMLGRGKVAMVIEGSWVIPFLHENFPQMEFATAEVPRINDRSGTMMLTVAYVMNRESKHKQAAWELISYLTSSEGMAKWASSGLVLPTRRTVALELGYDRDPLRIPLIAGVKYATTWQIGQHPALVMNNFNNQFFSALLGEQPLTQAMKRAENEANEQIQAQQ